AAVVGGSHNAERERGAAGEQGTGVCRLRMSEENPGPRAVEAFEEILLERLHEYISPDLMGEQTVICWVFRGQRHTWGVLRLAAARSTLGRVEYLAGEFAQAIVASVAKEIRDVPPEYFGELAGRLVKLLTWWLPEPRVCRVPLLTVLPVRVVSGWDMPAEGWDGSICAVMEPHRRLFEATQSRLYPQFALADSNRDRAFARAIALWWNEPDDLVRLRMRNELGSQASIMSDLLVARCNTRPGLAGSMRMVVRGRNAQGRRTWQRLPDAPGPVPGIPPKEE
ncbi:MAG: hypothetical protein AB1705_15460, partial [Verrucomicrobiota bacterium]